MAGSGLAGHPVSALAINPSATNTLYAGTFGDGVFKSTDAGSTWIALSTGLTSTGVSVLVIDPSSPARIYAGTRSGGVFDIWTSRSLWMCR